MTRLFVRALALGAFVALACWASPPAEAASKEIERLQIQVAGLQGQLATLQRALEDQTREIKRLNEQLADQNAFMKKALQDQRLQEEAIQATLREVSDKIDAADRAPAPRVVSATPEPMATPPAAQVSPAAPSAPQARSATGGPAAQELYSQAYADYARGHYDLAVQGFQDYIKANPDSSLADNAQYWIGECLYGKKQYNEAVDAWKGLIRDYPSSDKLPDGRVKMGMALEKLGKRSQALLEYRFVIDRYPNSPAARIAREKLNPQ